MVRRWLQLLRTEQNDTYALTVPNDAGGVTAFVTAYAAVNPNTKCAEEVFKYLELFYSDAVPERQRPA